MMVPSHADYHPKVLLLLVLSGKSLFFQLDIPNMIVIWCNISFMLCLTQPPSPPVHSGVGLNLDGVLFVMLSVLM